MGHFTKCEKCKQIIDKRDFNQMFAHTRCNGIPIDYKKMEKLPFSGSQKIGDPIFYVNNKDKTEINLN